ncbi:MAG TPA: hypothetical protein VF541_04355 [Longimicrobium sp.]
MFALLTLPRGVPNDPELPHAGGHPADVPVGIIIRPGPAPVRVPLRDVFRTAA